RRNLASGDGLAEPALGDPELATGAANADHRVGAQRPPARRNSAPVIRHAGYVAPTAAGRDACPADRPRATLGARWEAAESGRRTARSTCSSRWPTTRRW